MHRFVYLASASPRRAQLLDQIGVAHRALVAAADEDVERLEAERRGEAPEDYVRRVTRAKLRAARRRLATRALAETAQRAAVFKDQRFSDHAPLTIDYNFTL